MPTVLRVDGFSVRIYPNDHTPEHVHVLKAGAEVIITIEANAPVVIREVTRMRPSDVAAAVRLIEDHVDLLLQYWNEIHD
jgi:hypothetical protein